MTDEEWNKFQQWHNSGASPATAPPASGQKPSVFQGPFDAAMAAVRGAGKEAVQTVQSAPWATPIPETKDSPSPLMSWARSKDPQHPMAEGAGRLAADVAPTFAIPELSPLSRLASISRIGPALERGGQALWKGAIGGGSQPTSDRERGAETGAGTALTGAAARGAWGLLPHSAQRMIGYGLPALAALAMMQRGKGGGHGFWPLHYATEAVAPVVGAGVAGLAGAPGAAGALGARAEDEMNPNDNQAQ